MKCLLQCGEDKLSEKLMSTCQSPLESRLRPLQGTKNHIWEGVSRELQQPITGSCDVTEGTI
eukprot:747582-Hanusia_phi.AAC.2